MSFDPDAGSSVGPSVSLQLEKGGESTNDPLSFNLPSLSETDQIVNSLSDSWRWSTEAQWGISVGNNGYVGIPYFGISQGDGNRTYQIGWRLIPESSSAENFSFDISIEQLHSIEQPTEFRLQTEFRALW